MGWTLLCWTLLRERWSWSHRSRRFRSAEWDAVNVFPPNTPVLVLTRLYRFHTHRHASLLPSSSAALTTIRVFFVVPIVPPLCRIYAHIRRVSAHRRPPRLCSPRATACPFRRCGIPSPTRLNYRGTFRVLSSGPPSAIISPSSHHLCLSSPPLVALHLRHISTRCHRLHRPGIFAANRPHCCCLPLARVRLSVFYHHFHPRRNPHVFLC